MVSVGRPQPKLLYPCLGPSDRSQRLHRRGNEEPKGERFLGTCKLCSCSLGFSSECAKYSTIAGKAVGIRRRSSGIWRDNGEMPLRAEARLRVTRTQRGGSEVLLVWVPCPLPSLGSHKLARCNSLPDGLAPAGVCLYIPALTGGCGVCSFCDLRCWECRLEGNRAT